jgi:hypothetical protein
MHVEDADIPVAFLAGEVICPGVTALSVESLSVLRAGDHAIDVAGGGLFGGRRIKIEEATGIAIDVRSMDSQADIAGLSIARTKSGSGAPGDGIELENGGTLQLSAFEITDQARAGVFVFAVEPSHLVMSGGRIAKNAVGFLRTDTFGAAELGRALVHVRSSFGEATR